MNRATILNQWLPKLGPVNPASDPFRDPVGYTVGEVLPILADVVLGERPLENAAEPLERLMRIRVVQELTPSQAVEFLLEPKTPARDQLILMAFDAYMRCREEAHGVQVRELRRRIQWAERWGA